MLSEEQKKAIKFFERRMDICIENANICDENNFDEEAESLRKEQSYIDTILNLITKLQKENEQKDKQIDLMAEEIRNTILIVKPESKFCQYEEDCKNIRCKDCIKQFFEKQAKEI